MAYSELVKNFDRIRDYMRQFYIYGFKSRTEYGGKSPRSYDNERRRMESWLGEYMRFRRNAEGKQVFLCVDSRTIPANPLYKVFKAKSFTDGDVTFHFYVLDLLRSGESYTVQEILDRLLEDYLSGFEAQWQPDLSTLRKKLKEYTALGLLEAEKQGRLIRYRLARDRVSPESWADAIAFFSEADPLGVIGSTLLDRLEEKPEHFRFKHHYILHALDAPVMAQLLQAIGSRNRVALTNLGRRSTALTQHTVCPLKLFTGTQGGRQYLLCYHYRYGKLFFFRLDHIQTVTQLEEEPEYERYLGYWEKFRTHLWGTSIGVDFRVDHLELTVRFAPGEEYILQRLEREKRNGRVERLDGNTCRYTVDTYDAAELLPWLRTFIGRIVKLECSDRSVVDRFYADLERMYGLYEEGEDAVF